MEISCIFAQKTNNIMESTLNDSTAAANSYPHNGQLLENYILNNRINRGELARKMNVTTPSVHKYALSPTLQLRILWKASVVLKHNFVAELGALLPVRFVTPHEEELKIELQAKQSEIEALQKQIEHLNTQISVYKSIVEK